MRLRRHRGAQYLIFKFCLTTFFSCVYNEMAPSQSRKSESRRSSILKPRKPRRPLQNVNFNSSSSESSPATIKVKRRVSFAEKKHVKEFCHSTEQGTVWDNTYEEHDCSIKASPIQDQHVKDKPKENVVECISIDSSAYIPATLDYEGASNIINDQLPSTISNEIEENVDCDLDFTEPVEYIDLSNARDRSIQATLLNSPVSSHTFNDLPTNSFIVYRDIADEDNDNNCGDAHNAELEKTCVHNLSMEFTVPISASLLSSHLNKTKDKERNVKTHNVIYENNSDGECTTNCNNVSVEFTQAVPISVVPAKCDLDTFQRVPVIVQNCENIKCNVTKNIHKNISIFSRNVQSSKCIVSEQMQDVSINADDSMELTGVIQPLISNTAVNHVYNNDENTGFNISMELTTAVPPTTCEKSIAHSKYKNILRKNSENNGTVSENIDKTEFFNDVEMEITRPINNILPLSTYDKENRAMDDPIPRNDGTIFFHNLSMEMTKAMTSKCQSEINNSNIEPFCERNKYEDKGINNSIYIDERTKLLHKSMDITEAVSIPVCHKETFNIAYTAQSTTSTSPAMSRIHSSPENPETSILIDTTANDSKTRHNISMEITTAVPTMLYFEQHVTTSEIKDLIASENNVTQHVKSNRTKSMHTMESEKNIIENNENILIVKKNLENEYNESHNNFHNLSMEMTEAMTSKCQFEINNSGIESLCERNTLTNQSLTHKFDKPINAAVKSIECEETIFFDNNDTNKNVDCSFMVHHQTQKNNTHLKTYDDDIDNAMCDESSAHLENIIADTCSLPHIMKSNYGNSLEEVKECSFLRKSWPYLQKSSEDLQAIKPPSFVSIDSEGENTILNILQEEKLQTSMFIDTVSIKNKNCSSTQMRPSNMEEDQIENDNRSTIANDVKDNPGTNYQTNSRRIINDNKINELNSRSTDPGESILSICENQEYRKASTRKSINVDINVQISKQKRQCTNLEEKLEIESNRDQLKEVIINPTEQKKCYEDNLNDEVSLQSAKLTKQCSNIPEIFQQEERVSMNESECFIEQDPFLSLLQNLETYCAREDCIWNICHKNIEKKMIVFGFMSNSLLIVTSLSNDLNQTSENLIKGIKIISCVSDEAGVFIKMVHKIIFEKIDVEILTRLYITYHDISPMLDFISQDVKLAMDFMFDLKRLDNLNIMEIARDRISFVSRSRRMDIILKVTMNVKRFDKLTANDVDVCCLLGTVKETDVKNLIKSVKRDYKFLRRYMNDVQDYIDIMEGTCKQSINW